MLWNGYASRNYCQIGGLLSNASGLHAVITYHFKVGPDLALAEVLKCRRRETINSARQSIRRGFFEALIASVARRTLKLTPKLS
jgi:hypothetical protein